MDKSRRPGDTVGLAAFKAHLSAYLRRVRRGEPLTILYRDVPIARVLPWTEGPAAVASRPAKRRLQGLLLPQPVAPGAPRNGDSLAALVEERRERR